MTAPEVVFYDGACGLCHGFVRFVLRRDAAGRFAFAPLGGATFLATFPPAEAAALPASVVVRTPDGRTLVRSDAVLHVLRSLGGVWRALAAVLRAMPRPVRDIGYRFMARVRRRLLRPPVAACPTVPAAARGRMLP